VFQERELQQIRNLLNLTPEAIFPNSELRRKAKSLESFDLEFATTLVIDIQSYLARIEELDNAIALLFGSNPNGIKRKKIDGEYEIEYGSHSILLDYYREKDSLIAKIAREFNFSRNNYMSRYSR
jgi:hypothetical protein